MKEELELAIDYPSKIAKELIDGQIDIGLVPLAILPQLKEYHFVGDYCISCRGPVASVCLFSEVPMESIEFIYLDYQSRTSVELLKILLRDYWKHSPKFLSASPGFEQSIKGNTAALIIGDRALAVYNKFPYRYDLGEVWNKHTGLPFVFAAWISRLPVADVFTNHFNNVNAYGFTQLEHIIQGLDNPSYDMMTYYTKNIEFRLNEEKLKAIELFLQSIQASKQG
jgi:chorismate dehydratase